MVSLAKKTDQRLGKLRQVAIVPQKVKEWKLHTIINPEIFIGVP